MAPPLVLGRSGASLMSSSSLLSSCLIDFRARTFEGEKPSLPGRTMVSASESLLSLLSSRTAFCRSVSIVTSWRRTGGDDLKPFGAPGVALLGPSGFGIGASGGVLSFAASASTAARASISSSPCAVWFGSSSWATVLGDTLSVWGEGQGGSSESYQRQAGFVGGGIFTKSRKGGTGTPTYAMQPDLLLFRRLRDCSCEC